MEGVKNVRKVIRKVILLLRRGDVSKASKLVEDALASFGQQPPPLLLRAKAEVMMVLSRLEENEEEKGLYLQTAYFAASAAYEGLPDSVEFSLLFAKLCVEFELYARGIDCCERTIGLSREEHVNPYEHICRAWDGKKLKRGKDAMEDRTNKMLGEMLEVLRKCKIEWLHSSCQTSTPFCSLRPRNHAMDHESRMPNEVIELWNSMSQPDRHETIRVHLFNLIHYVESNTSDGPDFLDVLFRFSISRQWLISMCGICQRKFSNGRDLQFHFFHAHAKALVDCTLPNWSSQDRDKIWGGTGDLSTCQMISISRPIFSLKQGSFADVFVLSIDDNAVLQWVYSSSPSAAFEMWKEKIDTLEKNTKELLGEINSKIQQLNKCFQEEKKDSALVMKSFVDLKKFAKKLQDYSCLDSQDLVEGCLKGCLKMRLEDCLFLRSYFYAAEEERDDVIESWEGEPVDILSSGSGFGGSPEFGLKTESIDSITSKSKDCPAASAKAPTLGLEMQLGKKTQETNQFLESLKAEGEVIIEDIQPSAVQSNSVLPPPVPIIVTIEEKLNIIVEKNGAFRNFDLQGTLSLQILNQDDGFIQL